MSDAIRENRRWLQCLIILGVMLAAAAGAYAAFGRDVIRAAYSGRAWAPLNSLIRGQQQHPVEHYFADADTLFVGVATFALVAILIVAPLGWRSGGLSNLTRLWQSLLDEVRDAGGRLAAWFRTESLPHVAALAAITLAGATARGLYLSQPIRFDEAYTITRYASAPLWWSMSSFYQPNNHILHTLLVHVSMALFGDAPWAVRLPAFLAGVAMVPAAYAVARAFYGRTAALLAAALVASCSILIEFSTNARGYTIMALFTLLIVALAHRVRRHGSPAIWVLIALCSALGAYTQPTMFHPVGIVMLWLLLSALCGDTDPPARRFLLRWLGCAALTGLLTLWLYIPVFTLSGPRSVVANRFIIEATWANLGGHLHALWLQWNRDWPIVVTVFLLVGVAAASILYRARANHRVPLLIAAVLWLVPVNFLLRVIYTYPRIWLFILPLFLVIAAGGWGWMIERWAMPRDEARRRQVDGVISLAALGLGLWLTLTIIFSQSVLLSDETGTSPDAGAVAEYLQFTLGPGDRLIASDESLVPMIYYFQHRQMKVDYTTPLDKVAGRWIIVVDNSRREQVSKLIEHCDGGEAIGFNPRVEQTIGGYPHLTIHVVNPHHPGETGTTRPTSGSGR